MRDVILFVVLGANISIWHHPLVLESPVLIGYVSSLSSPKGTNAGLTDVSNLAVDAYAQPNGVPFIEVGIIQRRHFVNFDRVLPLFDVELQQRSLDL